MRLSRGCYDKYRRCPGWAGGGSKWAQRKRCENGHLQINYEDRLWRWKFQRCDTCDVLVLPMMTQWLSPEWNWFWWRFKFNDWRYWRRMR